MWEPYIRAALPVPNQDDLDRLQRRAEGTLPRAYWDLVTAHQGETLDEDIVEEAGLPNLLLLLVALPEQLDKACRSYTIDFAFEHMMPRYPAGLFPFGDDTGGNAWAFDFRSDRTHPSIVFIDHELDGEEGVTPLAPDFAALLARIGATA